MEKQYDGLKVDKEHIWKWYLILGEYDKSGLPRKKFCALKDLNITHFNSMLNLIYHKSKTNPKQYKKDIEIFKAWQSSDLSGAEFTKQYNISMPSLSILSRHFKYLAVIEQVKQEGRIDESKDISTPMTFHKVAPIQPVTPFMPEPESEVVKKQNDVELVISKGIRVMVAPEVGADKLIRIIELLKDL